jgi:hypothetical protein
VTSETSAGPVLLAIFSCRAWPEGYTLIGGGKIPEGINALTVITAQHAVEHQQHSRMKNHDVQAEVSTN